MTASDINGVTPTHHSAIRACADCGHLEAEHKTAGTGFPHPPRFGACLAVGCGCRAFAAESQPDQSDSALLAEIRKRVMAFGGFRRTERGELDELASGEGGG